MPFLLYNQSDFKFKTPFDKRNSLASFLPSLFLLGISVGYVVLGYATSFWLAKKNGDFGNLPFLPKIL